MKAWRFLFLSLSPRREETIGGDLERRGGGRHKDSVGDRRCLPVIGSEALCRTSWE